MGEGGRSDLKTVLVCSSKDAAGANIKKQLIEGHGFRAADEEYNQEPVYSNGHVTLITSDKEIINVDDLDADRSECRYVFLSKHRAESGIPSLTAHFTGNFGPNKFGGNPNEIARYSTALLKNYVQSLVSMKGEIPSCFNITLEATHHGPTSLRNPLMFAELGSDERQWNDPEAASFVADAVMASLQSEKRFEKCGIGIGGTHYPEKFNKVVFDSEFAMGPVVPKYSLPYFDETILSQILSKGDAKITTAFIDTKGLGRDKQRVMKIVSDAGLEIIRV